MTWWGWLLEIVGLCLLALAIFSAIRKTMRRAPLKPFALPVSAVTALVTLVSFTLLGQARPPGWLLGVLGLFGLIVGGTFVLPARVPFQTGWLHPSQGYWYLAAWSSAMFVSSLLVVLGRAAAKVAGGVVAVASAAVFCYAIVLYAKYRAGMRNGAVVAAYSGPGRSTPPSFCRHCGGARTQTVDGAVPFCRWCGGRLA